MQREINRQRALIEKYGVEVSGDINELENKAYFSGVIRGVVFCAVALLIYLFCKYLILMIFIK